jgi:NADPH2:quinone reductase
MGGLASAFPAVARSLGASRVVGTERRSEKAAAAREIGLDRVVVGQEFPSALAGEEFDVVVDAVGGEVRLQSLPLLAMEGRLLAVGNASGAASVQVDTSLLWRRSIGVVGYAVGSVLAIHPEKGPAAAAAVLPLIAEGKLKLPIATLPLVRAAEAQQRMVDGSVVGRLLLTP